MYLVLAFLLTAIMTLAVAPLWMPDGYRVVEHGVSESAAQGVDGAWIARTGFVLLGLGVCGVSLLAATRWPRAASAAHLAFGLSLFGVASFSTRSWEPSEPFDRSEDVLHSIFATTMGFAFIAGVVIVAVARRLASGRLALPDVSTASIACLVPLTMSTPWWGLLQRVMFVTAAWWYWREARACQDHVDAVGEALAARASSP